LYEEVDEGTPTMPLSAYAEGKLRAEKTIFDKAAELPHFSPTVVRLTTIFGWSRRPRLDLVTNHFCYKALVDNEITIHGQGQQYRSLIHVRDVANALVESMEAPRYMRDRKLFHVGEETNNVTVRQIGEMVNKYVPEAELVFTDAADSDRRDYRISCQRIRNTLGWQAKIGVEEGIREVVEKLRSQAIDMEAPAHRNNKFEYV
jgi:nucleoside-diphosphate-sugar epimerase